MEVIYNNDESYIQIYYNIKDFDIKNNKILFDLDNTIIKPKRLNHTFYSESDYTDWIYTYDTVKETLKKINKTHNIYIITNQKILTKNNKLKPNYKIWIKKLELVLKDLDIPIKLFASLEHDNYRKPNIGSIDILNIRLNKNDIYCGDALGRKNDHTDTDLKFALNLNIKICSPEYIFLKEKNNFGILVYPKLPTKTIHSFSYNISIKELIILVGLPASGKSSLSKKIVRDNYKNNKYIIVEIINQDNLKTINKCLSETEKFLSKNISIIIDKTNPTIKDRKLFIDLAKKYNYKSTCIIFNTNKDLAVHNNHYRAYKTKTELIPTIVYNKFNKYYEEPNKLEGFDNIININSMCPIDLDYFKFFY